MELQCSYCGRLNSAEVPNCFECGTPLSRQVVKEKCTKAEPLEIPTPKEPKEVVSADEWRARDAWKCLGMFVVFEIVMEVVRGAVSVLIPGFRLWSHGPLGRLVFSAVHYTISILTMVYFARIGSRTTFIQTLGLEHGPSRYVWFAAVMTVSIRLAGHLMYAAGWDKGVSSSDIVGFTHTVGPQRYLFLVPSLLAPFCEELYMRGFLYRAFRGSFSIPLSLALIVGFTSLTHWNQFSHSWVAALDLSALTILQCFLRERGNLWDCITSHLVFNVTWVTRYALSSA